MRELREASGESVEKLAKKAKISLPRWYAFERGKAGESPRIEKLWELERALSAEPHELARIVYPQVVPALVSEKS
jgi:transcriptional regulator with XRE-family HTH domain